MFFFVLDIDSFEKVMQNVGENELNEVQDDTEDLDVDYVLNDESSDIFLLGVLFTRMTFFVFVTQKKFILLSLQFNVLKSIMKICMYIYFICTCDKFISILSVKKCVI